MFDTGQHLLFGEFLDNRGREARHFIGLRRNCSRFHYGLSNLQIEHRSNVEIQTEGLELGSHDLGRSAHRSGAGDGKLAKLSRDGKLLKKIEQSLRRIEDGTYGWCEETGEPIGIPRLLARPTATLTIEAQSRRELKQKLYGD